MVRLSRTRNTAPRPSFASASRWMSTGVTGDERVNGERGVGLHSSGRVRGTRETVSSSTDQANVTWLPT